MITCLEENLQLMTIVKVFYSLQHQLNVSYVL